jgi:hypothetical protein
VSDGGVDNGALGGATDLGEIGEQRGQVEESSVKSFPAGAFYSVVGGTTLSSGRSFTSSICIVVEV